jgi:hypothetical protein
MRGSAKTLLVCGALIAAGLGAAAPAAAARALALACGWLVARRGGGSRAGPGGMLGCGSTAARINTH